MSRLKSLPKYPTIDIGDKQKIISFIEKERINFIQLVDDRNVIYLTRVIGNTSYREAKVVSKNEITYEQFKEIEKLAQPYSKLND